MKIAFVYNKNNHQYDYEAEFDGEETINALIEAIKINFEVEAIEATKDQNILIDRLKRSRPDLIFNVAEGYFGPAREAFYPSLYDQLGYKFTGPDSTNLLICHNKYLSKVLLEKQGVPTTHPILINNLGELKNIKKNLKYPLFVKYNSEGSGIGIDKNSKVKNFKELKNKVYSLLDVKPSSVLIENYMPGLDISCAYIEGLGVCPPCIVSSSDNTEIYDYEHKTSLDNLVIIAPLERNKLIIDIITNICTKVVSILDIRGYAKIDLRLDGEDCKLVEVNGQVSFHPKGEFMISVGTRNLTMSEIIKHIINYRLTNNYHYSSGYKEEIYVI